jgi:hypothetical protein
MLDAMIPIIALMIPIVAILTYHQRKMAEIVHGHGATPLVMDEIRQLRLEVQQMKEQVHQQAIVVDSALNALRIPSEEANHIGGGR